MSDVFFYSSMAIRRRHTNIHCSEWNIDFDLTYEPALQFFKSRYSTPVVVLFENLPVGVNATMICTSKSHSPLFGFTFLLCHLVRSRYVRIGKNRNYSTFRCTYPIWNIGISSEQTKAFIHSMHGLSMFERHTWIFISRQ